MEQLNLIILCENAGKTCGWVKHALLQKSSFFDCFSISEENCVAGIIDGTFK